MEYEIPTEELGDYLDDMFTEKYGTDRIISDKGIEYENKELPKGFILSDHLVLDEVTFKPYLHEIIDDIVVFEEPEHERFEVVKKPIVLTAEIATHEQMIETLEGNMLAHAGDYILTGTEGERWAVKKHIFEKTYDIL